MRMASSKAVTRAANAAYCSAIVIVRFAHAHPCATREPPTGVTMPDTLEFSHAENGMTRFPPNVEQISVEHESLRTWLIVRRNDISLRFPLCEADCRHLASLLDRA